MEKEIQILKLSASSMKTYEQCPKKYYYNYIEKLPKKDWSHLDLGNLCHKTLELFHKNYIQFGTKHKTLAKLMEMSFKEAIKEFQNTNKEILLDAKKMLDDYLKKVKKDGMPIVKGIEKGFEISLSEDVIIRGFIDRVDIIKDGSLQVVDYKTTKNEKYLDEFQLLVYGLWLQQEFGSLDYFSGSYVLLKHGSKTKDFEFNNKDLDRIKRKILDYANKIKTEDTWTPIPTILCVWCDFKNICPAHKAW